YPNNRFLENVGIISENIPKAGSIKMYTSGCPNIQTKFSQMIVLPPIVTSKKADPNSLSNIKKNILMVNGGNAIKISDDAIKVVHVNNGILINDIPGARIVMIVARKLIPDINVPKPEI